MAVRLAGFISDVSMTLAFLIAYFTPRRPPVSRHGGQAFHAKAATDFTHGGHPPLW
jgi:hypothetical protein